MKILEQILKHFAVAGVSWGVFTFVMQYKVAYSHCLGVVYLISLATVCIATDWKSVMNHQK